MASFEVAEFIEVWACVSPSFFDLHADPFESAEHEGIDYSHWRIDRIYLLVPAQAYAGKWISSFKEFPPRQRPASFNLNQVMTQLTNAATEATDSGLWSPVEALINVASSRRSSFILSLQRRPAIGLDEDDAIRNKTNQRRVVMKIGSKWSSILLTGMFVLVATIA